MMFSFYKRVVVLLCSLVLIVQLFNLSAVLTTLSASVKQETNATLDKASELIDQFIQKRSDLLLVSAEVLAADFGFRAAIASDNAATIQSALINNISRVDADLATFVSLDGRLVSNQNTVQKDQDIYNSIIGRFKNDGVSISRVVIDEYARTVVVVPVKAPLTIGWLALGFSLNDDTAALFAELVGMDVTFTTNDLQDIFGSSFSADRKITLVAEQQQIAESEYGSVVKINGNEFLTKAVNNADNSVTTLLHTSLDQALADYRGVQRRLLSLLALSLLVTVSLALWFAHGVTNPVKALSKAANQIRQGNYKSTPNDAFDTSRSDEIGQLMGTFKQMQLGIADREATISYKAYYDELTDLPNLVLARKKLNEIVAELNEKNAEHCLYLIGLNRYKQVVNTLGHSVGEHMIQELARRLSTQSFNRTLLARIETDEFLLHVDTEQCNADSIARQIINLLEQPVTLDEAEISPDVAVGFVTLPDHCDDAETALQRVRIALSDVREKENKLGCYQLGSEEIHLRRLSLVADLKRAVEDDELTLHFQPKISMRSRQVFSVEALVRWIHPTHGFMPPDEFIGLAESSGNVGIVTHWVLNSVIRQLRDWERLGIHLKAAVNLSALDVQDDTLFERINGFLEFYNVSPNQLIVEVTESAMMKDTRKALDALEKLRGIGCTISIDDFGTGYSSLAKLKDLPIDELKIDRSFVSQIKAGSAKAMIIKAIIDLGHSMGLSVICEGVETEEEWALLNQLGNDVVQGYLISKPLEAEEFTKWWRNQYEHTPNKAA